MSESENIVVSGVVFRKEQPAAARLRVAEERARIAEERAQLAEQRALDAERKLEEADALIKQAEAEAQQATARLAEALSTNTGAEALLAEERVRRELAQAAADTATREAMEQRGIAQMEQSARVDAERRLAELQASASASQAELARRSAEIARLQAELATAKAAKAMPQRPVRIHDLVVEVTDRDFRGAIERCRVVPEGQH